MLLKLSTILVFILIAYWGENSMAIQILVNLMLSVFWLFVTGSYTFNNFLLCFLFALLLVFLMRGVLSGRFYFITVYKIFILFLILLFNVIKDINNVIHIVINP